MGLNYSKVQKRRGDLVPQTIFETGPKREILPDVPVNVITSALTNVASYISQKGGNVTIIGVGGVVNALLLKSRPATHDLEFFNEKLTSSDLDLLIEGASKAMGKDPRLQVHWSRNAKLFYIPRDNQHEALTKEALKLNNVIFKKPGLTVLAAPWYYSFCCKLNRIDSTWYLPHWIPDLSDATAFLWVQYEEHGQRKITPAMLSHCKLPRGRTYKSRYGRKFRRTNYVLQGSSDFLWSGKGACGRLRTYSIKSFRTGTM